MEIALKSLAIIVVVVLVLTTLGYFILSQSGSSGTSASYDRVFFAGCEKIQQKGCAENDIISVDKDNEFLEACRYRHGREQGAFTCVYRFCSACSKYKTFQDGICGGECGLIAGIKGDGEDVTSLCSSYKSGCDVACSACP